MTVKTEKTGQHLRDQILTEGSDTRMRAMQALTHGCNLGSEAVLANLLLSALGGNQSLESAQQASETQDVEARVELIIQPGDLAPALFGAVAEPMMQCANDDDYGVIGVVNAG